jgi:hypothetical protein
MSLNGIYKISLNILITSLPVSEIRMRLRIEIIYKNIKNEIVFLKEL